MLVSDLEKTPAAQNNKMLAVTYDPVLVIASILVAIMGAFTCLRLTSGLRHLDPAARRPRIALAAIALGGGIWSMHFVGMLAVSLPVTITYSALPTLISVLVAILVVGIGLISLHFGARTQYRIIVAGALTGGGIVAMHYIGMSAIGGNCIVSYSPMGLVLSTAIGIGASIFALELAYRRRSLLMTAVGAIALGLAISAMHYVAMLFTTFELADTVEFVAAPDLSAGLLAMIVSAACFVICGVFLLIAIPVERQDSEPATAELVEAVADTGLSATSDSLPQSVSEHLPDQLESEEDGSADRIPYQWDNETRFLSTDQISAFRADGHYTRVINGTREYFCPWSISRVEKAVPALPFVRTHRSYLVNVSRVTGFKREGDKGFCVLGEHGGLRIPVSRSRMGAVQKALGLA